MVLVVYHIVNTFLIEKNKKKLDKQYIDVYNTLIENCIVKEVVGSWRSK